MHKKESSKSRKYCRESYLQDKPTKIFDDLSALSRCDLDFQMLHLGNFCYKISDFLDFENKIAKAIVLFGSKSKQKFPGSIGQVQGTCRMESVPHLAIEIHLP